MCHRRNEEEFPFGRTLHDLLCKWIRKPPDTYKFSFFNHPEQDEPLDKEYQVGFSILVSNDRPNLHSYLVHRITCDGNFELIAPAGTGLKLELNAIVENDESTEKYIFSHVAARIPQDDAGPGKFYGRCCAETIVKWSGRPKTSSISNLMTLYTEFEMTYCVVLCEAHNKVAFYRILS